MLFFWNWPKNLDVYWLSVLFQGSRNSKFVEQHEGWERHGQGVIPKEAIKTVVVDILSERQLPPPEDQDQVWQLEVCWWDLLIRYVGIPQNIACMMHYSMLHTCIYIYIYMHTHIYIYTHHVLRQYKHGIYDTYMVYYDLQKLGLPSSHSRLPCQVPGTLACGRGPKRLPTPFSAPPSCRSSSGPWPCGGLEELGWNEDLPAVKIFNRQFQIGTQKHIL